MFKALASIAIIVASSTILVHAQCANGGLGIGNSLADNGTTQVIVDDACNTVDSRSSMDLEYCGSYDGDSEVSCEPKEYEGDEAYEIPQNITLGGGDTMYGFCQDSTDPLCGDIGIDVAYCCYLDASGM